MYQKFCCLIFKYLNAKVAERLNKHDDVIEWNFMKIAPPKWKAGCAPGHQKNSLFPPTQTRREVLLKMCDLRILARFSLRFFERPLSSTVSLCSFFLMLGSFTLCVYASHFGVADVSIYDTNRCVYLFIISRILVFCAIQRHSRRNCRVVFCKSKLTEFQAT